MDYQKRCLMCGEAADEIYECKDCKQQGCTRCIERDDRCQKCEETFLRWMDAVEHEREG